MDDRCTQGDRLRGVDHRRQDFVFHHELAAAFLSGGLAFSHDGGDLLADEADDIVEHAGVVRVHPVVLMPGGREQPIRRVLMGQHGVDTWNRKRRVPVDGDDPSVRVRRTQHPDVKQAFDCGVKRVARSPTHHLRTGRSREAAAEGSTGRGILDVVLAVESVLDGAIAGAAADVSFQGDAEVLPLRLVQGSTGQDHACGTKAALKSLGVEKGLLQRMQSRR